METTIAARFDQMAAEHPQATALVDLPGSVSFSYAQLKVQADIYARGLMGLGLEPGAHMAILAPNQPEWITLQLAAAKSGLVLTNLDTSSDAEQLAYLLANSQCQALFMAAGFLNVWAQIPQSKLPKLKQVVLLEDEAVSKVMSLARVKAAGEGITPAQLAARQDALSPHDVASLMYTSGTTGAPKGVMATHYGLLSTSLASAQNQAMAPEMMLCVSVPLSHVFGCICLALAALGSGAGLVIPSRIPEPAASLDAVEAQGCAALYGAPTFFIAMLEEQRKQPRQLDSLKTGIMAGAPCPLEVMNQVVSDMGLVNILVGYGQTEASSWVTQTLPSDPLELRVSTVGRPIPGVELKIADPASGQAQPTGEVGEICCRGFNMKGYFNQPAATASALDPQGWLHTGDLGSQDDEGYVRIAGRLKEVIRKGGKAIMPTTVEEALYRHPAVLNVQAFGLPHPELGQEVAAWVILREDHQAKAAELLDWCGQHLEPGQVPAHLKIVDRFPMTNLGKVQKYRLSELYGAELGLVLE